MAEGKRQAAHYIEKMLTDDIIIVTANPLRNRENKKMKAVLWILKKVRRRIPHIFVMTAAHIVQAAFGVLFALGTKGVIDSAVSGVRADFFSACIKQGIIIAVIMFQLRVTDFLSIKICLF